MRSLVAAAVHSETGSASRRPLGRLLSLAPAALLVSGLLAVWAGPLAGPVAAASGDWPQFQGGPTHQGYNAAETTLSASNVAGLGRAWTGPGGSAPVVADGVVYVVDMYGYLDAYAVGCREDGGLCSWLWTGYVDSPPAEAPAVADGVVYYAGSNGNVYAFAAGCRSDGGTCSPLWTAATGDYIQSPVTVADGVVYVGSWGDKLYAFDATGVLHCSGSPKTCTPLWTGATGGQINAAPAVADGVVYIGDSHGKLYAFPTGCRSDGGSCAPTWTGTAGTIWSSSPAVANGVVYVGSTDDKLYAFQVGCNSGGGTCAPLWTGATGGYIYSSPAVANGVVYVGSDDWTLYAYGVGCNSGGGTCSPLWKGYTGGMIDSAPAVANGVVYVGSNGDLKAYAVGCRADGGYCTSIWTAPAVGASAFGSLALANGVVYVSCTVGIRDLYAFSLPPTTSLTVSTSNPYVAGTAHSVTVTAKDAHGNTAVGYRGTIHFTSSDPAATLPPNYTFTAADAGSHVFTVTLRTAGTQSVTATDTLTASIKGSQSEIVVNAAAVKTLVVSGLTTPRTAGMTGSIRVTAVDAYGNRVSSYRGTVHFSSSDTKAKLPANYTFAAADAGTHVFVGTVILKTAGTQSVTATDTKTATIKGSQTGIVVKAAALKSLVVSGLTTPRTAGMAGTIQVTAVDAYGNRVSGYTGTVHFTSSDAKAKLPANYKFTAADAGTHVFTVTLKTASTQSVTAADTLTKTIKGSQTGIVVKAAAVKTLTVSGLATPRTKGVAGTIRVTAVDAYGNRVSGYTGTVHFTSSDSKAKLPANYKFKAADAGTHVFSVTLKTAGTQSVTATDTVTKTITGVQTGIVVK